MKSSKIVKKVAALLLGVALGIGSAEAGYIKTQATVEPGKWAGNFDAAKAYADQNNIPLFVFWANTGCGHCEAVEKEMNGDAFSSWMAQRRIVMVFVESNSTVKKWIKDNALETIKAFPFGCVYWKSNPSGQKVEVGFSAYKGNMSRFGVNSRDSNGKQLMDTIDSLISGWTPGEAVTPVTPDPVKPDPVNPSAVDLAKLFGKSQKLEALAYQGDALFGKVAVTLGKYNARKRNLKVTAKISAFNGKTYTKAVTATPDDQGNILDLGVAFKAPVGAIRLNVTNNDGTFDVAGEGDDYSIEAGSVTVGGKLAASEISFFASFDDLEPENESFSFIVDPPAGAVATVAKGTTLNFGKAPSVKYVKVSEGRDSWYELAEYDEDRYPNANAVKLTYKYATGGFTGSFKLYASNEDSVAEGRKPTLKAYTAKVSGYVIDGVGVGTVSVKIGRKTYQGTCSFE